MHWLSFLIGALVGWLIGWLIDYLICRPRRAAAEAELRAKLVEGANREVVALKGQLAGHKDLQVRLDGANSEVGGLKAQLAAMKDLQVRLDGANREVVALKAQLAGMKDLQVRLDGATSEIDGLRVQLAGVKDIQADLDACRAAAKQYEREIARLSADLTAAGAGIASVGAAAGLALPEKRNLEVNLDQPVTRAPEAIVPMAASAPGPHTPDDLTIVEGIGPKIAELLRQNGIHTFAQLADASIEHLQAILALGGPRFRTADAETWPHQALLARDGEWAALKTLQDALQGGRKV